MAEIKIATTCGFCSGANNAVSKTFKAISEGRNVVLLKELLHNKNVKKYLEEHGAKTKESLQELTQDDFVIIRGHGEPESTFKYLEENKIEYMDCTCPNVKAINLLAKQKQNEGYKIIIVGKYGFNGKEMHPEVFGIAGWCENPIFIEDESEIENIDLKFKKYFAVVQTTFSKDKAEIFLEKIKDKLIKNNKEFDYKNTTCSAQKNINLASEELAKNVDIMIVIGGKNSSNTKELFLNVSNYTKAYKIENPDEVLDLPTEELKLAKTIGITAGASTMQEDIIKTREILNKILN